MDDELLREIGALKESLKGLTERVQRLEQRPTIDRPAPAVSTTLPPPAVRPPVPSTASVPASTLSATHPTASPQPGQQENLETKIGRYWLNRIGIISLVLGVAFFILYSFQYLGPAAKIGIGLAVGGVLIGIGVWLERRADLAWYARGLIGGGWSVVYFTTYAMYHIPAVRLLHSAVVDLILLLAVAAGAVWHALRYRSQAIAALAFLLGFITTSVSDVTGFTLVSSVLLVVSLVVTAVRMQWHGLILCGVVGSYLTHMCWIKQQIAMSPIVVLHGGSAVVAQFWLNAGFLVLYWAAYTVGTLGVNESRHDQRNPLLTATLVNGLVFVTQLVGSLPSVYYERRALVLLGIGLVYALLSRAAARRGMPTLSTAHLLLGLLLTTLAIPAQLTKRWASFLWLFEIVGLTWIGLRYNRWVYRVFAFGLGVVMFGRLLTMDLWSTALVTSWFISWRLFIGLVAIGSYAAAALCYQLASYRAHRRPFERQAFHLYAGAASIVAWIVTVVEGRQELVSIFWALEAALVVWLGWQLRDRGLRLMGAVWFAIVGLSVLTELVTQPAWWNALSSCGVVALLYTVSACYRSQIPGDTFEIERIFRHLYAATASVLLTEFLRVKIPRHWLSLAWAAEGFALVTTGLLLRDKVFRVSGLAVFGLLVAKVLFIDLAGVETIYRILSFIAVGAILLAASFGYARFSARGSKESGKTAASPPSQT